MEKLNDREARRNRPKFEIVNNTWIKSNIDIDECYAKTKYFNSFVYAIKIDAIIGVGVSINTYLFINYTIDLNTGNEEGLSICYFDDRAAFDKDLAFFENLLMNR